MGKAREIYGNKWSEKEYLIVLHYYFKHKGEPQHADTPFIFELSRILGRTPHSILYRLQNFASIDPEEKNPRRKGKAHITNFGKRTFEVWSRKRKTLKDTAEAFLRDEKSKMEPNLFNPNPVQIPVTFRDFELLDEVGRGGFGVVLSCINTRDSETYALKIIDISQLHNRECIARFAREIKALKSMSHPGIIRIHEDNLDNEKDYPGFVMDLAQYNLPDYLKEKAEKSGRQVHRPVMDYHEAMKLFTSVLGAVAALHQADIPILHRDINPNNILRLFNDEWVLADFSLAKFLPTTQLSTSFTTETHMGMGTAHYTAPEQYTSLKKADVRSDIFSLGWLLWDLFSSEGPYPRSDPSGLPIHLEKVFHKSIHYEPENRYQNIDALLEDLSKAL